MRYLKIILFLCFFQGCAHAVEQIDLTSPYVVNPTSTTFLRVQRLDLDWQNQLIIIKLQAGSVSKIFTYKGITATNMMTALNKANLTTNSLHKRVLNQLISDGFISGAVSGSPD